MPSNSINQQAEIQRIKSNIVYFSSIGTFFLLIFASLAIFRQDWLLSGTLFLFVAICIGLAYYTHTTQKIKIPRLLTIAFAALFYFYLLLDGGYQNTGYMWCFAISPVPYFLLDHIKGVAISLFIISITVLIFVIPDFPFFIADYSDAIKIRFVGAYLSVSILFFMQEYSRFKANLLVNELTSKLEYISRTDELTQLPNRRSLQKSMERYLMKLNRYSQQFGVVLIDIDHFKQVNDQYGHDVGDQVLVELSRVCSQSLRGSDIFGRWGGEEFLLILSHISPSQLFPIAEKIREIAENMVIEASETELSITISLGALLVTEPESSNKILKRVDLALYQAKSQGRNQTVIAD